MLSGRVGMSPVMVGRVGALARVTGIVDAAEILTGDQPSVALVSGEAGIGKTRLVRELVATLPPTVTALVASAQPGSLGRPGDALASLLGDRRPLEPVADTAVAAFDVVASAVGRGRVLLVVEDLHWMDSASAITIDRIAQQEWPQLVVLGTYRPGELSRGQPGGELVLRLERRHAVEQVRLERLDRIEVAALVSAIRGDLPSSAVVEALHRRSGGVPFVVEELLRCCGPMSGADDLRAAELPWSLEEAVQQQLAGLDPAQRTVVEALAVYGRSAPFDALVHVTEADDHTVLGALRSLTASDVVVEVADDRFWFSHALVADAIEHHLLGRERRRLHERSFEAVRAAPMLDHASLAHHAIGAGRYDEVPAIARRGAPRYLEKGSTFQALRLAAEGLCEAPTDPELLAVATEAAWRLDFLSEALGTATRWERVAVEPADRIEAMRFVARLHWELDDAAASAAARRALEVLAGSLATPALRGRAGAGLAQLHMLAGNATEAIEWARRARADAESVGDDATAVQARVEAASAMVGVCSHAEAAAAMDDALEHARRLGDAVLVCRAVNNSLDLVPPGSARGRALRAEMGDASARVGFDKLGASAGLLWDVAAAFGDGDLAALRRASAEGEQWWSGRDDDHCWLPGWQVSYALEEGRVADAKAQLDRLSGADPSSRSQYRVALLRLELAAAVVDRQAGRTAFLELVDGPAPLDVLSSLDDIVTATEAALVIGITADRIRDELFTRWLGEHPSVAAMRAHAEGLLSIADGEHAAAAAALVAVLEEPDPRLSRPVVGSLRTSLAVARAGSGDRVGAIRNVRRALDDDLVRWPGVRRDRAQSLARRLEGSSTRPDGELTAREREVAALLADGLTNGQLAERLYISPKTAAVHVSNILAKLGLSSRAEIAAWAVRHHIALTTA